MKKVFNPFTMDFDYVPFSIYQFPRNPDENCDSMAGYQIGDEWTNTESMQVYKCTHNATGEAMWRILCNSSSDKHLEYDFYNQCVVILDHNFGKFPAVTLTDDMGEEIIGDVDHFTNNRIVVTFDREVTGKIILN